ncbi:MAG: periplasmic binding protein-related protein [Proteobacteria bacterium]|nr:periplasmic binding protein-related protein [Pseudomonadota bacterium]
MKLRLLSFLVSLFCLLPFAAVANPSVEPTYSFSVAPQFERRQLFRVWQPIVDDLQKRTGLRFELVTSLSVGDYDSDVKNGRYDFIYVNPYMVPLIDKQPGYQPLIRDAAPLHGILVVRKDSPLQRVEDLSGKTLAVPSMSALGASLLLRAELDRDFGVKPQPIIAKTHSSVFLHVVNGLADAGGSVQKALAEQDVRIRDNLKVLHRTRDVPSHPIAVHQRVPVKVREQVRQAFLDMSADPQGRALLAEVPMRQAVAANVEDYQVLKTLKLDSYLTQ